MNTISDLTCESYWLILLNLEIPTDQDIEKIWNGAHKITCTDGAVNKLKDYAVRSSKHLKRGPDYIIGDFDSLKKESLKWLDDQFGEGSYKICHSRDQNTTDFDKSLLLVSSLQTDPKVVALNCFGGRLDHTMAILNSAYRFEGEFNFKIELRNEVSLARIIHKEQVEISFYEFVGSSCGILPLFGPVNLETSGLEWNLTKSQTIQFSGLISTSNRVTEGAVLIKNYSKTPFIWTHEILHQ